MTRIHARPALTGVGSAGAVLGEAPSLSLSRHDHHNLELKGSFQFGEGLLDFYLFAPGSMQLRSWPKSDLIEDIDSRVRLAYVESAGGEPSQLLEALSSLEKTLGPPASHQDAIFAVSKRVGAVLGEVLRHRSEVHRREMLLAVSLAGMTPDPSANLLALREPILQAAGWMARLRLIVARATTDADSPENGHEPVLKLLDQYAGHLYLEYLGSLRAELDRLTSRGHEAAFATLRTLLGGLQNTEARLHPPITDEIERELYVLRLSHFKKFFQSEMFVEVARRESLERFSEPAAAGAAALAAVWATIFQRMNDPNLAIVGLRGLSFLSLGIAAYVLKDRIKVWGRAFVTRRLSRVLPDIEQDLVAGKRKIGKVREWFAHKSPPALPEGIRALRARGCVSEAERHLPEDVFHYRRRFVQNDDSTARASLQESIRINLARFLKRMDDPYKSVRFLDAEGNFSLLKTHRIYHFHVVVTRSGAEPKLYRVVMDKTGIDRVEEL